jgi:ABC-type transport system substrate-binding protein
MDELLAKAAMTPNGPEREALYYQVQDIAAEDIPYIGIFNMQMFVGRHANCGGVILWPDNYNDYSHAYKIVEE